MPEEDRNLEAIDTLTSWQSTNDSVSLPLALLSMTLLIAWTYRCHRNLESLGHRELDCKHIWAIICWFIPVLHLFCPYQVMREIWWRSNPDSQPVPKFSPATHLVASWGLVRATTKIAGVLDLVFGSYETYPQYYTYLRITSVFCVCDVISSILCILIVQQISRWQVVRYQRIHESPLVA
jgi:hypothetical protein